MQSQLFVKGSAVGTLTTMALDTYEHMHGTPDLHPEGYDVVTDLFIGISTNGLTNPSLVDSTA